MALRVDEMRVRLFMAQAGIKTQKELAQKAGISQWTVTSVMDGRTFTSSTIDRIAEVLGVNPIDLLATDEAPIPLVAAPAFVPA